ncbi:hypothetical protein HPB47_007483, partial [Ixodes persulcatus]
MRAPFTGKRTHEPGTSTGVAMNAEEEDHNYHHGCPPRRDIFKITGHAPSLLSPTDGSRRLPGHRPASNNHHNQNNNNNHGDHPISDFFQMERVDKTPCLTPGTVFPTEPTPSYPSLAQVVFDSSKSPIDSCDSCVLEPGSTTTLLETPPKTAGLAEECCESLFVRWNWPALRVGCLLVCVSCLVAVLCVIVGVLLLRQPSCDPDRSWWQGGLMYEVFTASYVDSDDDGFGDFRGLASKLGYIKKLRASALRLTSVFSALDYPLEYEHIIDFDNVDPHLGHMGDFEHLVREVHRNGLRVVLDINPALTSDQHTWAAHWLLDQRGEYAHYYVLVNDTSMNIPLPKKSTSLAWKAVAENRTSDVEGAGGPTPRTTIVTRRPSASARPGDDCTPRRRNSSRIPGATARFRREFVENPFGVTCAVCDRLWFAGD